MRFLGYVLLVVLFIFATLFIVGLCLPRVRKETKQTVYNASIETVYNTVVNNKDWKWRTSLDNLQIIETNDDFEVWEEISQGSTIRFKTKEKTPFSFYSFEMNNKFFQGEWFAEFESVENGKTRFIATELIIYKNPLFRVLGYAFMDLDGFMGTYQNELKNKLENASR
jgi:hypothetical protein